jgi:predicted unusual protein kinase regulating ubiquinone biosynthesis (AarF/ABC1/UbiB family)
MDQNAFQKVFDLSFPHNSPFKEFNNTPIASASIGQVHFATLHTGEKVAVKLRRYTIKNQVLADIKIINFFNFIFRPLFSHHTKNSIEAVIKEFSVMIRQEISFNTELQNLLQFSEIYKNSGVRFPKPYVTYCSDSALVMSFEQGYRFDDKKNILKNKIDFKKIIKKLVNFYTDQMLIQGYFHADPHPGNLLVNNDGELILLDFGMVKRVPNHIRVAIIELIKAANEKDYELYISANKRLGTIAYEAPTAELAEFTSKMFEIFGNENLTSESMQKLAFEVLESTRDLPFKLPSDAIYILRVSAIIEGLGTTYIENFNGVKDILPILQENMPKALGAKESISETLIDSIKDIPFVVTDFKTSMKKISEGSLEVEIAKDQLDYLSQKLLSHSKRYIYGFTLLFSGFFVHFTTPQYSSFAIALFLLGLFRIFIK